MKIITWWLKYFAALAVLYYGIGYLLGAYLGYLQAHPRVH
jgi:hypothetical protein